MYFMKCGQNHSVYVPVVPVWHIDNKVNEKATDNRYAIHMQTGIPNISAYVRQMSSCDLIIQLVTLIVIDSVKMEEESSSN